MSQSDLKNSADQQVPSDQELIRLAQRGSLEAFTMLYQRYLPTIYNRVRCLVPAADVEDVTQEVCISLLKALKSFRGAAKFGTWLRTLTDRRIADYYRRRSEMEVQLSADVSESEGRQSAAQGTIGQAVTIDDQIALREALRALPEHYREIIILRFAEGLRFHEIAKLRGQSLEATKSLFRRAIAALREHMGEKSHV